MFLALGRILRIFLLSTIIDILLSFCLQLRIWL